MVTRRHSLALLSSCGLAACAARQGAGPSAAAPAVPSRRPAPDEQALGRDRGYPVGNASNWYYDESVRVGSFTRQAQIRGIFGGGVNTMAPAAVPMRLPRAAREPAYRWDLPGTAGLGLDDFLARQRVMGLMIVHRGIVQAERYQYERGPDDLFTSNSMAKSVTALAVGIAIREGLIGGLDDRGDRYSIALRGTPLGQTTLRNLLRMASGIRYEQRYDRAGDTLAFSLAIARDGCDNALRTITERVQPEGSRFYYTSPHTVALASVLRGATGGSLSQYLASRLWQPIGAAREACWRTDKTGLEVALGNFNATLADYARLGVVLANDGHRPDRPDTAPVIPPLFLREATDWRHSSANFQPGIAGPGMGYGLHFWTFGREGRAFAMLGVYGQSMFVDPELGLVVVMTGANATADAAGTSLARERAAFWKGIARQYRQA